MIEIKNLSYAYPDGDHLRVLLKDVNVSFSEGILNVLSGRSGCGKTSLLYCLGGFETEYEGRILFDRTDIRQLDGDEFRRKKIAFIFQNFNLFGNLSVLDNIRCALAISDTKYDADLCSRTLRRLGIREDQFSRKVSILSGGEQQRVAIARALLTKKDIILADEPTGNLDLETSREIIKLLKALVHETGKTMIVVSHDPEVISEADRLFTITGKKILETR
ncbi:MAG: ABC transporter ATP-binding protein [Erysipelotrichaceae bacterium]|nr:ABC transporter ATP-binding protein [Erysipelotrichaceae bacterium]